MPVTTDCEQRLVALLAEAGRGPKRDGLYALWLVVRAAEALFGPNHVSPKNHRRRLQAIELRLGSLALPAPLKRALVAARQHLEVATPEAAAGVLRQLLAPAREVLGADAAEALSLALRAAKMNDQMRAGIGAAAVRLRGLPLTILPLAAPDLETAFERLAPLRELALVLVDYLQLVPAPASGARGPQDEELAQVLRRLKAVALERQVALLVVAQLPKFHAERENPRPTLDDFGHLGAIKQHADVVLAIFREEMYRPGGGVEGATELLVAKNRNGPTGFVDLYFYRRWMRFEDMLDPDR